MGLMPESEAQRPPPSETYLRELEEQLLAEFSERNARIERLRRLRHMETPVDIPPAYRTSAREVRTPLAREQLKRVIGSLTANRPLVHVPPAEPTEAARTSADRRARWTNAALRRMDSEAARDVFGMLIDAMVAGRPRRLEAAVRAGPLGGLSAAVRTTARNPLKTFLLRSRAVQEVGPLPAGLARRGRDDLLSTGGRGRAGSLPGNRRTAASPGPAALRAHR